MIGMLDRVRVRALVEAGHAQAETAPRVGVSLSSVQRILHEGPIGGPQGGPTAKSRGVGRPSVVEEFRAAVADLLAAEPALPTVEVLHRARELGYGGKKSALYAVVRSLRAEARRAAPLVRFEGVAGEFSQHDFGQVRVTYTDGTIEKLCFFASRLKYSRWSDVRRVPDEKVEALVRALLAAFEAFGGVPLQSVFDNPKTIVLSQAGGRPEWNPTFAQVAADYSLGVQLCTPRQPQQKGSVENLVGWVKSGFFKVRRFHDRADAAEQLSGWVAEGNTQRPSRATGEVPAARIEAERARLRPLAIAPGDYALRLPVTVRTTGFVEHAGLRYSMPPETIGIPATLFLYPDRVRILTKNGVEATHPRIPAVGTASYRPADRVAKLAAVHGARARLYLQRQEILELGPPAEALLTEWVHRPHYHWKHQVEALHALLILHGPARVLAAIERALADRRPHADAIAWLLAREAVA
jgi:transposase